jgi:hypothetical protein
VHWFGLIVAMTCLAYRSTLGLTLSVSYMIDSYQDISGNVIVAVILVRNTMPFAVNYGITPWLTIWAIRTASLVLLSQGWQRRRCSSS